MHQPNSFNYSFEANAKFKQFHHGPKQHSTKKKVSYLDLKYLDKTQHIHRDDNDKHQV